MNAAPDVRDARLEAIVSAVDAFGVAVERREDPAALATMLAGIRDQLAEHDALVAAQDSGDAAVVRAIREANAELMREIDGRVALLRTHRENGLAAHGLLLSWLYHTRHSPLRKDPGL